MADRTQLEQAIAALENQRAILGDAVVDAGIAAIHAQLEMHSVQIDDQRKLVTILFADISGFTTLSETLDAEDVTTLMNALWTRLDAIIVRHGGWVDKHIGDALMALWGVEKAREDDPEQAVRAALALQTELTAFREQNAVTLAMRIGINTGHVLLGTVGSTQEFTAMGDAVNLASRIEHAAPVGGILVAHDTYRHIRGLFDVSPQPALVVRGKREPVQTYIVLAAKARTFYMPTRGIEGIETHTIGRDAELLMLQQAYHDAIDGSETQLITVVGDVGVGKSRLLAEFEHWIDLRAERIWLLRGRAIPETLHHSGGLLRNLLSFRCEIQDTDSREVVREKLITGLAPMLNPGEAAVLGQAAGFDFADVPAVQAAIGRTGFTEMAAAYLASYLHRLTDVHPALLVLEDLHWADDRSLDLLDAVMARLLNRPLLVVSNTRPALFERRPEWGAYQIGGKRLVLHTLSIRASRALVEEILRNVEHVPLTLRDTIVAHADGNPFYIEELIKMLLEQQVIVHEPGNSSWVVQMERLDNLAVPPTLTGVLQARLDSLPPNEKTILQCGSVIGRAFWDASVQALLAADDDGLIETLDKLRTRELVFRRKYSAFTNADEYVFKHALLRDVTYESVLKRLRRVYHRRAAHWIEHAAAERVDEHAALIADHYAKAEDGAFEAIWQIRAGRWAVSQHAHDEAVRRLDRALELLPDDACVERYDALVQYERVLDLRGQRDLQAAYLMQLERLVMTLGDPMWQADIALRWANYYTAISEYDAAVETAQKALLLVSSDQTRMAAARLALGYAFLRQGDYRRVSTQLEPALELARAVGDQPAEAHTLRVIGLAAEHQGDYMQARLAYEQALSLHQALSDLAGKARTLNNLGVIADHLGDYREARARYEEALPLCIALGDRVQEATVRLNLGEVARALGEYPRARADYEDVLAITRAVGERHGQALALVDLGHVATAQDRVPEARRLYEGALTLYREIGDPNGEAIALDGLGHVLIQLRLHNEAVEAFESAILLRDKLGLSHLRAESQAGLACTLLAQGNLAEAHRYVDDVLAYLETGSLDGAEEPMRAYLCCIDVLRRAHDSRAEMLLTRAYTELEGQAARMDAQSRQMFLEIVPYNRAIQEAMNPRNRS